ncbi:MAG: aminoglycoside phosphotransferase family protein [Actinobacteria bacterium]|nr:aminoglycoside phosphotransferase family protein [Actinomycetota bacterium]
MHADEIETDVALVRRLLSGQFPEWADLALEPVLTSGTVNALYRLGDDLVVRLPRNRGSRSGDLEREFRWLPALSPLVPVAVPEPLAKGAPGEGYPWEWGVYRWLDGENPTPGHASDSLAEELARFVLTLHRVELADGPPSGRGASLGAFDEATRAAIAALEGEIDAEAATAAWEEALATPEWPHPPVWAHGDLMPGNLLMRDCRLAAVIDWGAVGIGDPACDLMVAWNLLPADARPVFRAALGYDDATWARGRGWALWTGLVGLPYYRVTNPGFAAKARRTVGEILAEIG